MWFNITEYTIAGNISEEETHKKIPNDQSDVIYLVLNLLEIFL